MDINDLKIVFSAMDRRGNMEDLKPDPKLSPEENHQLMIDNATSMAVFTDNDSDVPALMEHMQSLRTALSWKGDVKPTTCKTFEDNRGRKIEGRIRVGVNRDLSIAPTVGGFAKYVAGLAR